MSSSEKLRFSERLATFMAVKEFTLKGKQDYKLEEDIKALISHEFVRISMGMNDYLGQDFEQFIIYNHPFATPKYKFLHTLELYHEDGVIILSKPDLIKGFQNKAGFLNLALFAAISAFISMNPRAHYPELKHIDESQLETTFNIEFEAIKKALGFDWLNKLNVLIYCFFEFPRIFEATFPKEFFSLQSIFND